MSAPDIRSSQSVGEVLRVFLRLGLTSFGGPIAHLGYYHREFVKRRLWLNETQYAELLAPCQFLPGPASTQFGFSVGLLRAGWRGALTAFIAFTLPSALLMYGFAEFSIPPNGGYAQSLLNGLKLVALAVVAQGVLTMARSLTPDPPRILLALIALGLMQVLPPAWSQLIVILLGAALAPMLCRSVGPRTGMVFSPGYGPRTATMVLTLFALLLAGSVMVADDAPLLLRVAAAFYKTGALIFGGGHVVLPLLKQAIVDPGWLSESDFLAAYGAAQAVPGPMFSIAAFLGARLENSHGGALGATISVIAIFLPGLLLVSGVLPFWNRLTANARAVRAMAGVNAAVVGILCSALYDPLWVGAVHNLRDFLIALAAFVLLAAARAPALIVVAGCVAASVAEFALTR